MLPIDQYLNDMRIRTVEPSEVLIEKTLAACRNEQQKTKRRKERKVPLHFLTVAIPAAAILVVGILIGAFLFSPPIQPASAETAYFTIDVNPSIMIAVDQTGQVVKVSSRNEEARPLIDERDYIGLPAVTALRNIIEVLKNSSYLQNERNYVLIGYFGSQEQQSAVVDELQAALEQKFGDLIELLFITGSLEEKAQADQLKVSPALLKLSRMADQAELNQRMRIEDILDDVNRSLISKLHAPEISCSSSPDFIDLTWEALNFDDIGYTGKVVYLVVAGQSEQAVKDFSGQTLARLSFYTNEQQPLSYRIKKGDFPAEPGQTVYWAVYAQYSHNLLIAGPVVRCDIPQEKLEQPTVTPKPTTTPKPTVTPQPTVTPKPSATPKPTAIPNPTATPKPTAKPTATPKPTSAAMSYWVYGQVKDGQIVLKWEKETSSDFRGYKVVASQTNPKPEYPADGYLKYITNPESNSLALSAGQYGLEAGVCYYFSVTYLYDSKKIAGQVVELQVPDSPAPTPAPYLSSQINGSLKGNLLTVNWEKIIHSQFSGYKIMYSFSNPQPVYGDEDSNWVKWITTYQTTSDTFDVTGLTGYAAGATGYFSISVVYKDNTVMPGNVLEVKMP